MAKRPAVAIVGCGRAGGSIGLALERAGYRIAATWSRSRGGRQRASRLLEAPVLPKLGDCVEAGDVVIVAVPDDAIASVAREVAEAARVGQYVVHTSGATSIEALAPVRAPGARVGSMHPLQTLPDPRRGADALRGAAVAITCEEGDRQVLHRLASGWGGRPFPLPDDARSLYHAAAVFASNYVVGVLWAATDLLQRVGVANPSALLGPLVEATVHNVVTKGAEEAITGPIARGDLEAVRNQVEALREGVPDAASLVDAYRALAVLVASLARTDADAVRRATA